MKRQLSEEEKRLWQYVTRHDKALHPLSQVVEACAVPPLVRGTKRIRLEERGRHMESLIVSRPLPSKVKKQHADVVFSTFEPPSSGEGAIKPGAYANIDRNTAERFRRGQYPLDGTLDLHGMNREKAWRALHAFIHGHAERGSRCLLVITGKGNPGVLRELLPRWLDEPQLRPLVLAFDTAAPRLGGSGAYAILLKRKRV